MTPPKRQGLQPEAEPKDEAKVPEDEYEFIKQQWGVDDHIFASAPHPGWGDIVELIKAARLAGRREGAEAQREKDAKIVDLTPGVYGSRELSLVEHIAKAIRLQTTEEEGEK